MTKFHAIPTTVDGVRFASKAEGARYAELRLMAAAGAIGAVVVMVEALSSRMPSGWASIAVIMLLVGGLQCLMLGIIGEYVGRTFLSANGKPQGTVRLIERSRTTPADSDRNEAA